MFFKTYFLCFWVSLPLHSMSPLISTVHSSLYLHDSPFIILLSFIFLASESIHHYTFRALWNSCYWLRFLAALAWLFNVSKQTALSKEKAVQQSMAIIVKSEIETHKRLKKEVFFKHDHTSMHHPCRATPMVHHT